MTSSRPGRSTPSPTSSNATPRPSSQAPFHPPSDMSTYRDLLLFEERLKTNAEMLRRRRRRYSFFLWSLVAVLMMMAYHLLVRPPTTLLALRALQGCVAVVFITLGLFFASGMYEEKIRYINHSNKALRPLNMHLNMRRLQIPLLSYIPFLPSHLRSSKLVPSKATTANKISTPTRKTSAASTVMAQIPPTTNPRGELIFSSRVDRSFREGYERYRSAFERRREERAREEAKHQPRFWMAWKRGRGASPGLHEGGIRSTPTPPLSRKGTPPLPSASRGRTPSPGGSRLRPVIEGDGKTSLESLKGRERAESYSFVWTGTRDTGPLKRAP
ncbi:hypothetical protein P7C73_g3712, partial [Tremellales sp. Uapishka_1]